MRLPRHQLQAGGFLAFSDVPPAGLEEGATVSFLDVLTGVEQIGHVLEVTPGRVRVETDDGFLFRVLWEDATPVR